MSPKINRLEKTEKEYAGAPSTLCMGCGHDAISASIRKAFFESSIDPKNVIKLSGIGCSSKTPAYFMSQSVGINSVHGRMSAVATGAHAANANLIPIGVSGDGDTSAIGLGNFCHMIRRNIKLTYVIENNGVYGLTKGQFSATADRGTVLKKGKINNTHGIDLCELAITMGATFVARSFSGDRKQLAPLMQAALAHDGIAVLDVLSPCTTFNNHEGSTKSLKNIRANLDPVHDLDFIPNAELIEADYEEGSEHELTLHDGSVLNLKKLHKDYSPHDQLSALRNLREAAGEGKFLTGLIYLDTEKPSFARDSNLSARALSSLNQEDLRPNQSELDRWNQQLTP